MTEVPPNPDWQSESNADSIPDPSHDSIDAPIHDSIEALIAAEPTLEETVRTMPARPMRFTGRRSRDEHVRKHVLQARNERWHQLIDADLLDRVRSEGAVDRAFEDLARAYVQVLDEAFADAVQSPAGPGGVVRFVRFVRFEVVPPRDPGTVIGGFRAVRRSILAWCPHRRLRIVAGFPVSNPEATAYRLLSGYRSDLQGSARRFDRTVLRRLADRTERSQDRLLDPLPDAAALPAASGSHG